MLQAAFATKLAAVYEKARTTARPAAPPIAADDKERIVKELDLYLQDLERVVLRSISASKRADVGEVRENVKRSMNQWRAYTTPEGSWLKYVNRLRPGAEESLMKTVESAVDLLHVEAGPESIAGIQDQVVPPTIGDAQVSGTTKTLTAIAQKILAGVISGAVGYCFTDALLRGSLGFHVVQDMPGFLIQGIATAVFLATGSLGIALVQSLLTERKTQVANSPAMLMARLAGWPEYEQEICKWLAEVLQDTKSPAGLCQELAKKLQIELPLHPSPATKENQL